MQDLIETPQAKIPHLFTRPVHNQLCNAALHGATFEVAAHAAGINRRTLGFWLKWGQDELKEDPTAQTPCACFVREFQSQEAECEQKLLKLIIDAAPKNWTAAAWMLERKHPGRYAKVDRLRLSGDETNNTPVQTASREEIETRLIEKLAQIAGRALERANQKIESPAVIDAEVIEVEPSND